MLEPVKSESLGSIEPNESNESMPTYTLGGQSMVSSNVVLQNNKIVGKASVDWRAQVELLPEIE